MQDDKGRRFLPNGRRVKAAKYDEYHARQEEARANALARHFSLSQSDHFEAQKAAVDGVVAETTAGAESLTLGLGKAAIRGAKAISRALQSGPQIIDGGNSTARITINGKMLYGNALPLTTSPSDKSQVFRNGTNPLYTIAVEGQGQYLLEYAPASRLLNLFPMKKVEDLAGGDLLAFVTNFNATDPAGCVGISLGRSSTRTTGGRVSQVYSGFPPEGPSGFTTKTSIGGFFLDMASGGTSDGSVLKNQIFPCADADPSFFHFTISTKQGDRKSVV